MTVKLTQTQLGLIKVVQNFEPEYMAQRVLANFYMDDKFGEEILLTDIMAVYEERVEVEIVGAK
ncbi:hypothetical protein ESZ50_04840 [Weissella muntiaci]|uniref:Uncharacterized protein n=1 Tax=Weissella muntiaci TaxID=2508881 RepID=A0A6C2C8M3_9LACO|nr:hypothetical protein [Weissella muntiaci]TYC49919.1 hypothetical protein ESZ50_04840 [Weissella muntiaci]